MPIHCPNCDASVKLRCPECNAVVKPANHQALLIVGSVVIGVLSLTVIGLAVALARGTQDGDRKIELPKAPKSDGPTLDQLRQVDELNTKAADEYEHGNWSAAFVDADPALAIHPDNLQSLYIRGISRISIAFAKQPRDHASWAKGLDDLKRASLLNPDRYKIYEKWDRLYRESRALFPD